LTEDQSDWAKFGYGEGQIEMSFLPQRRKCAKVSKTLDFPLRLCAFAGEKFDDNQNALVLAS